MLKQDDIKNRRIAIANSIRTLVSLYPLSTKKMIKLRQAGIRIPDAVINMFPIVLTRSLLVSIVLISKSTFTGWE
jgi:hypothetical protein